MRKVKELNVMDKWALEAARGLHRKGLLPSVIQYNEAVKNNKLIGRPIDDSYTRK